MTSNRFKTITINETHLYYEGTQTNEYACNHEGEGLFFRARDGSWSQWQGTGQTPVFASRRQFRDWLRRNYNIRGRTVDHSGWDEPQLYDAQTGEHLRAATASELEDSLTAAKSDGGAGVIARNGRRVYAQ